MAGANVVAAIMRHYRLACECPCGLGAYTYLYLYLLLRLTHLSLSLSLCICICIFLGCVYDSMQQNLEIASLILTTLGAKSLSIAISARVLEAEFVPLLAQALLYMWMSIFVVLSCNILLYQCARGIHPRFPFSLQRWPSQL